MKDSAVQKARTNTTWNANTYMGGIHGCLLRKVFIAVVKALIGTNWRTRITHSLRQLIRLNHWSQPLNFLPTWTFSYLQFWLVAKITLIVHEAKKIDLILLDGNRNRIPLYVYIKFQRILLKSVYSIWLPGYKPDCTRISTLWTNY